MEKKQITLRLPADLYECIQQEAERNSVSVEREIEKQLLNTYAAESHRKEKELIDSLRAFYSGATNITESPVKETTYFVEGYKPIFKTLGEAKLFAELVAVGSDRVYWLYPPENFDNVFRSF